MKSLQWCFCRLREQAAGSCQGPELRREAFGTLPTMLGEVVGLDEVSVARAEDEKS